MKKLLFLALFALIGYTVNAQGPDYRQRAINVAEGQAHQCLNDLDYPNGLQMFSDAYEFMICDYLPGPGNGNNPGPSVFGYKVHVYGIPNCPGNVVCKLPAFPVATVYVDCSGSVTNISCGVIE